MAFLWIWLGLIVGAIWLAMVNRDPGVRLIWFAFAIGISRVLLTNYGMCWFAMTVIVPIAALTFLVSWTRHRKSLKPPKPLKPLKEDRVIPDPTFPNPYSVYWLVGAFLGYELVKLL